MNEVTMVTDQLKLAKDFLGIESAWLQPFEVADPFNNELRLTGYFCQKPDHRYGALALLTVADEARSEK